MKLEKKNLPIWHTFYSFFFLLDCKIVACYLIFIAIEGFIYFELFKWCFSFKYKNHKM